MEVPQARWMVDVMENPIYKWMTIGGTPILGNPNMGNDPSIDCRSLLRSPWSSRLSFMVPSEGKPFIAFPQESNPVVKRFDWADIG